MAHSNYLRSFQRLNILTTTALMALTFIGFVQVGLAGSAIDLLEQYRFLPLAGSAVCMAVIFASSGTRDYRYYNPLEGAIVGVTFGVYAADAFLNEVHNLVLQYDPWAASVMLVMLLISGAILAR